MLNFLIVDKLIKEALLEDSPYGDVTTSSIVRDEKKASSDLIVKENGVICGLPIFIRVFEILGEVEFKSYVKEGDFISKGVIIGKLYGNASNILIGERIALNILQRLSGIATETNKYVSKLKGLSTKVLDTRKTTPTLRHIEKYAVSIGGGMNHRFSLSDGILIKDNHIGYAGGIKEAINLVRESSLFIRKIEVEAENEADVLEALEAKADIIMLDNMSVEDTKKMVKIIRDRALIESSGNITLDNIRDYAETGVHFISSGSLTNNIKCLDISLKNLKVI
ncbi:carboxylating nicotinate-nucleotide diphosphorylase [Clostridium sp.]|uniref:carboxylating nicotinate-nucleotide diphosphorylase n=1 Tax=Clostridium sp. TaxID=1506 RepID=UPI0025BF03D7|nr:carboxylating nicotinate-nucleotide diphosphorylase [Clostridium sp.]